MAGLCRSFGQLDNDALHYGPKCAHACVCVCPNSTQARMRTIARDDLPRASCRQDRTVPPFERDRHSYVVIAQVVMAYIATAYVVMVYIVMPNIVMV